MLLREDVQEDLLLADLVLAKIEASDEDVFLSVNSPSSDMHFSDIVGGIKVFRSKYRGKLALQIMLVENNQGDAKKIAGIVKEINPDEIQLNTPLRPCSSKPLSESDLEKIKQDFLPLNIDCKTVYEAEKQQIKPINAEDTKKRHGEEKLP